MEKDIFSHKLLYLYHNINTIYGEKRREYISRQIIDISYDLKKEIALLSKNIPTFANKNENELSLFVNKTIKELNDNLEIAAEGLKEPFKIFIIGIGNVGKSTLINALANEEIAKVNMIPETWKLDVFTYRKANNIEIRYSNSKRETYTSQRALEIIKQEEAQAKEIKRRIRQKRRELKVKLKDKPLNVRKEAEKRFDEENKYSSSIIEVHYPINNSNFLKQYQLIDTPGIDQILADKNIEFNAKSYYSKADGIIWLLPADKITSKETYDNINTALEVFGKNLRLRTIAVVNRIDYVKKSAGEEGVKKVLQDAKKYYGALFDDIIPISAKQAFDGQKLANELMIKESNLSSLQNTIYNKFYLNRQKYKIDSIDDYLNKFTNNLVSDINQVKKLMDTNMNQYNKLETEMKEEFIEVINAMHSRIENVLASNLDRIKYKANNDEEKILKLTDNYRKTYILENIIQPDLLKNDIQNVLNVSIREIQNISIRYYKMFSFTKYPSLQEYNMNFEITKDMINIDDDFGLGFEQFSFTTILGGIGAFIFGPIGLALAALSFTDFGKSIFNSVLSVFGLGFANKIVDACKSSFSEISSNIEKEMKEKINKIINNNILLVGKKTYSKLYCDFDNYAITCQKIDEIQNKSYIIDDLNIMQLLFNKLK